MTDLCEQLVVRVWTRIPTFRKFLCDVLVADFLEDLSSGQIAGSIGAGERREVVAYGKAVAKFVSELWELVRKVGTFKKSIKAVGRIWRINERIVGVMIERRVDMLQVVKIYVTWGWGRGMRAICNVYQEVILIGGIQETRLIGSIRDRRVTERCALCVHRRSKGVGRNDPVCRVVEDY